MVLAFLFVLGGCASRWSQPAIAHADAATGYRFVTRPQYSSDNENLVILAFSGGGTRAAAFSYGVLEFLRNTEVVGPKGNKSRLLDHVGVITGVSGGSFTALAYGLYGDKLFDRLRAALPQTRRAGELPSAAQSRLLAIPMVKRLGPLGTGVGPVRRNPVRTARRSATSNRGDGPLSSPPPRTSPRAPAAALRRPHSAVLRSDLNAVRLSRAAAASSAVPVVLAHYPQQLQRHLQLRTSWLDQAFSRCQRPARPAARATRHLKEEAEVGDSISRPYIHIVDGGVSRTGLGMRSVLDSLEVMEALHLIGQPSPLDHIRRIVVFVVNSLSTPKTAWDKSGIPAGHAADTGKGHRCSDRPLFL
ncbi:patatin-like phospholipase family protein [Cupriavidus basilensis]